MRNAHLRRKTLIILLPVFAVLLVCAWILYGRHGDGAVAQAERQPQGQEREPIGAGSPPQAVGQRKNRGGSPAGTGVATLVVSGTGLPADAAQPRATTSGGPEPRPEAGAAVPASAATREAVPGQPADAPRNVGSARPSMPDAPGEAQPAVHPQGVPLRPVFADEPNAILRRERLAQMVAANDPALPATAIRALNDPDPTVVIQGAQILGRLAHQPAVPDLLATLVANDQRPDGYGMPIKRVAIAALGACRDRRAVPALTAQLQRHEDLSLDNAAVQALGAIADPTIRPAVAAHLARLHTLKPIETMAREPWQESVRLATEALRQLDQPR